MSKYKSPLRYPGGKSRVASQIADHFPPVGNKTWIEPFVGGGSVFLAALESGCFRKYFLNDAYKPLMDFYKICSNWKDSQQMREWLYEMLLTLPDADYRKHYFNLNKDFDKSTSSYFRATHFFFRNRCSFSGSTQSGGFSKHAAMNRFTKSSIDRIKPFSTILQVSQNILSCLDYKDMFDLDSSDAFFFLDPPYVRPKKLYGKNGDLHNIDHEGLARRLSSIRGKALLTYDDCPEIRELYKGWNIYPLQVQYGMDNVSSKPKKAKELIIRNY